MNDKILTLQKTFNDLRESAANETKSTAGDKHETALAMLQIEQENVNRQLKDAMLQKAAFEKIDPLLQPVQITTGSLVQTNKGWFFVSVALGKIMVDDINVIAVSPQSPLGIKLKGLRVNDSIDINGLTYVILSIG
ncbi:MAG TPA: hypothetical protein VF610_02635 [Segetibacter sp.]